MIRQLGMIHANLIQTGTVLGGSKALSSGLLHAETHLDSYSERQACLIMRYEKSMEWSSECVIRVDMGT